MTQSSSLQIVAYISGIILVIFVGWYAYAALIVKNGLVLPTPLQVAQALIALPKTHSFNGSLTNTIIAVGGGFVLGVGAGLLVGFVAGISKMGNAIVTPYVNFFNSVPKVIFLPLFMFAFGLGIPEQIYFGGFHAFFVMSLNTSIGVRSVDPNLLKLGKALKMGRLKLIRSIVVPSSLPMILTGVRYGFLLDFLGVLLAEMYISSSGIGSLLVVFGDNLQTSYVIALALVISAIAIVVNQTLITVEHRFSSWSQIRT